MSDAITVFPKEVCYSVVFCRVSISVLRTFKVGVCTYTSSNIDFEEVVVNFAHLILDTWKNVAEKN